MVPSLVQEMNQTVVELVRLSHDGRKLLLLARLHIDLQHLFSLVDEQRRETAVHFGR